jgi:nitrogen fixation protein NifU and related proteins
MDLYAENILDHYKHPRNTGHIASPTVSHREENLSCGDDLTVDLVITDGVIDEVKWRGEGCAISQAAMSLLSEELTGMTADEAMGTTKEEVLQMLGVPVGPRRLKCALLSLHTLRNALRLAARQEPQSWLRNVEIDN